MDWLQVIKMWIYAYFYAALAIVNLIVSSFKVGFKTYWTWKVVERPECLDDKSLGSHGFAHSEDVRIHYVASGPKDKPLMVFVHGFPEIWYSWKHQILEFQKDYRVVAFDMRGYNESGKPKDVDAYSRTKLMEDIKLVILALGYKSCILVGHDWGGVIVWMFGRHYPDFVDKMIVMNAPPTGIIQKLFREHAEQQKKSWYIFFYQVPFLPELLFKVHNFKMIDLVFSTSNRSQEEIDVYKHVWSQPGALTPPMNYYRASLQKMMGGSRECDMNYTMPVLLIWGCLDVALSTVTPDMVEEENPKITVKRLETGDHFVHNHMPDTVNKIMRDWLEG